MFVAESKVKISALLTTAVEAKAILPVVFVVQRPVGINVTFPPFPAIAAGGVIVAIAVTPDTKLMPVVGAIVVALAMVGAAAFVAWTPDKVSVVKAAA